MADSIRWKSQKIHFPYIDVWIDKILRFQSGEATVTITGKGSYEGVTATTTFKINEKRITIPAGKTLTYNGEEQFN